MSGGTDFGGGGLFGRLKTACEHDWRAYVAHDFVTRLGDGSLPEAAFRHYLIQDYLFLIQFARAYALAAYKSRTLSDMRAALSSLGAILDHEIGLHVAFCAGWGIDEAEMEAAPEAPATLAYTRYVLDVGQAGDLLDLHVALAPCIVGYGEIGARLAAAGAARADNPYAAWVEMYAGDDYRQVAAAEIALLDDLAARYGAEDRVADLTRIFMTAVRLETDFWQMGLDATVSSYAPNDL